MAGRFWDKAQPVVTLKERLQTWHDQNIHVALRLNIGGYIGLWGGGSAAKRKFDGADEFLSDKGRRAASG